MLDHERAPISKAEREKLLQQIEEGLAYSREIIAQIDNVRRDGSVRLAQEARSERLLNHISEHSRTCLPRPAI
jgi:hypothetical protein